MDTTSPCYHGTCSMSILNFTFHGMTTPIVSSQQRRLPRRQNAGMGARSADRLTLRHHHADCQQQVGINALLARGDHERHIALTSRIVKFEAA